MARRLETSRMLWRRKTLANLTDEELLALFAGDAACFYDIEDLTLEEIPN